VTDQSPASGQRSLPEIDTSVPHSARIWNYWLGGKDNYPVDRDAGDQYCEIFPRIIDMARASRYFLARAVRYLAAEAQIRQFLDIGTGLPTVDNTHEVAQRVAPESRIVYVDNDPLVLAHARALLSSTREGATNYVDADLYQPDKILEAAGHILDFNRPIALMLMGIMGHVPEESAQPIVDQLVAGLPSGSHLVLYDGANVSEPFVEAQRRYNEGGSVPYILRSPERITRFFDGLEILDPGVVSCSTWRPDPTPFESAGGAETYGGVGHKP
jgi:O-methyltransferase involved in polyketide biosynthesis